MSQATSGKVLREARERKGYDLNTVARRLRIRPDILRAIEMGDFASMPPRGYARNMVNAYAKLLGLNPTEIVNMYLDEAYAAQVEKARVTGPSSGFNMQRETRRSRSQLGVGENSGAETRAIHPIGRTNDDGTRQFSRVLYDDGTPFSRDDYGVTRQRTERPGKSERDFSSHHSGYDSATQSFVEDRSPRRGNRSIYAGQTPMQYSASRLPGFLQSRAVLIALGVAVVVIIVIVLVVVLGGHGKPAEDDVSTLPVSGISDTTGSESSSSVPADVAPTSVRVMYGAKGNDECYVEIYNDGTMSAENLSGTAEKTVDVTGTWTITTWTPEYLKVTVDGQNVELKASNQYGGMYAYTVDFASVLKQWQATHNGASTGSQASTATGTSSQATGTSSSAAGGSNVTTQSTNTRDDGTNYQGEPSVNGRDSQNEDENREDSEDEESDEENSDEEDSEDEGNTDEENADEEKEGEEEQ